MIINPIIAMRIYRVYQDITSAELKLYESKKWLYDNYPNIKKCKLEYYFTLLNKFESREFTTGEVLIELNWNRFNFQHIISELIKYGLAEVRQPNGPGSNKIFKLKTQGLTK